MRSRVEGAKSCRCGMPVYAAHISQEAAGMPHAHILTAAEVQ